MQSRMPPFPLVCSNGANQVSLRTQQEILPVENELVEDSSALWPGQMASSVCRKVISIGKKENGVWERKKKGKVDADRR